MANMETGNLEAGKYGAVEAAKWLDSKTKPEKKNVNYMLALGCVFVPWLIFVITYYTMSFYVRYASSLAAYGVAIITLLVSLGFGWLAYKAFQDRGEKGGDFLWLGLLCLLCLLGWVWAFVHANSNYSNYMEPYYDLQQLNVYKGVDPSTSRGNQYMDFGVMGFVKDASIDRRLAMAFKNGRTYCAAPLRVNDTTPASYDFWAVGFDCCSSQYDYQCGEWNAHQGLRVARESLRSFYQLTVEQAMAAHNIKAQSPIYFEMVTDPATQINGFQDDGMRSFLWHGTCVLCALVVIVIIAVFAFSNLRKV